MWYNFNMTEDLFDYVSDDAAKFRAMIQDVGHRASVIEAELGHRPGTLKIQANETKNEVNYPISIYEPPYVFDPMMPLSTSEGVTTGIATLIQKSERSDHPHCTEVRLGLKAYQRMKPPADFELVEKFTKDSETGEKELSGYSAFIPTDNPALIIYLGELMRKTLKAYRSSVQPEFGCCEKYKECSDAGKCIHKNVMFSTACQYKRNLEAGKRFY